MLSKNVYQYLGEMLRMNVELPNKSILSLTTFTVLGTFSNHLPLIRCFHHSISYIALILQINVPIWKFWVFCRTCGIIEIIDMDFSFRFKCLNYLMVSHLLIHIVISTSSPINDCTKSRVLFIYLLYANILF